eukprot:scaffold54298_cov44-Phaeocystis_antarctica.AAC.1
MGLAVARRVRFRRKASRIPGRRWACGLAWSALAHPDRVSRLTRGCPPPLRLGSDPALAHTDGPFRRPVMTTRFSARVPFSDILA